MNTSRLFLSDQVSAMQHQHCSFQVYSPIRVLVAARERSAEANSLCLEKAILLLPNTGMLGES